MKIINGKKISNKLNEDLADNIRTLKSKYGLVPSLVVIIVGKNPASKVYVRNKEIMAKKVGIKAKLKKFSENISEKVLLAEIKKYNNNNSIDAILVQLPLPDHISSEKVIDAINFKKDVDGFNSQNIGLLSLGRPNIIPCTPLGCFMLIKSVTEIKGKNITIIGRSSIVGKPLAHLLTNNNATVTLAHSKTKNIKKVSYTSDILIVAIGKPKLVKQDWIKKGTIIIDVGINSIVEGSSKKLIGDVDYNNILHKARAITPVPGGVGPMTIHCLLLNTTLLAIKRKKIAFKGLDMNIGYS